MSTPWGSGPGPSALPEELGKVVQIQVMKIDGSEVLATTWMVTGSYLDVREQLTGLFGPAFSDAGMDLNAIMPGAGAVMADPATRIQFGGAP